VYVPNYIPEPLEVPGNVTQEPYPRRLAFLRRVGALHLLSILVIAVIATLPVPDVEISMLGVWLAAALLGLSLLRIAIRGSRNEGLLSSAILPVVLGLAGVLIKQLWDVGIPAWSAGVGVAAAVAYAMLCGRDYSFVGQFMLALIASSVLLAGVIVALGMSREAGAIALGWNAVFLFYYVYDLASLQARRRLGEELGAVVDLYRDVLNVFGYVFRVIHHWHKHRIWSAPR
jgi:FtsH-binding integral membrane protein